MYHISITFRNPVNNKDHSLVSVGSPDHLILSTEHMLNAVNNVNTSDAHHHVISTTAGMNNHYANKKYCHLIIAITLLSILQIRGRSILAGYYKLILSLQD